MKLTPITSKIKRTTKGGMVQQPLLNMGAPVKMKMSSPAKKDGGGYKTISFKEYRESGKMDPSDAKYYKGSGTKRVRKNFEKQLPAGDGVRVVPSGSNGGEDFREKRFDEPKAKKSYDQAYKDSRNVKEYAGMSKAEYIKEAKRQTASKKSGKGWDAKRSKKEAVKPVKGAGIKGAGTKTVKTKAKATSTSKKEITSKNNSSSFINNKRTADIVKGKVNAKPAKEVKSKKVKKSTKVKYDPSTGTGGSVAGNLIRSITGSRRRDRANAAERKAKGQASKAVSTDSKVDFKQFIGKTKETPAKKKKSAAKKKK